jgi:hypothetical protein
MESGGRRILLLDTPLGSPRGSRSSGSFLRRLAEGVLQAIGNRSTHSPDGLTLARAESWSLKFSGRIPIP